MAARGATAEAPGGVDGATTPQGAEQATAPPALSMADIAALIVDMKQDVSRQMDEMRARVEKAEQRTPQFRPIDNTTTAQALQSALGQVMPGQPVDGGKFLPVGTDSHVLPDAILDRYQQEYEAGDRIRLNRDAQRDGHELTWGQIVDQLGTTQCPTVVRRRRCPSVNKVGETCPTCGFGPTVKKVYWFEKSNGQWAYNVRIHGLTTINGMLMYGNELERA